MYCMSSGSYIPSEKNECHTNNNIALLNKTIVEFYINTEDVHAKNFIYIAGVIYNLDVCVCQSLHVRHIMRFTG